MVNKLIYKNLKPTSSHFLTQPFWRYLRRFLGRKSWSFLYIVSQKIKLPKLLKLILNNNFEMPSNLISVYNEVEDFKTDKKISTLLKETYTSKPDNGYLNFLDDEFEKLKNKVNYILEIGIGQGSGLISLQNYFYKSKIIGFDIDSKTFLKEKRIECHKYDQLDLDNSEKLMKKLNLCYDLIIDDGWHHPEAQVKTLSVCLKYLNYGGVYIIEDIVHSDYEKFFIKLSNILENKGFETQYINFNPELIKSACGWSGVLKITRKNY